MENDQKSEIESSKKKKNIIYKDEIYLNMRHHCKLFRAVILV